jgi:hypothetical protein
MMPWRKNSQSVQKAGADRKSRPLKIKFEFTLCPQSRRFSQQKCCKIHESPV